VRDGKLHAIIDFGCMSVGDPACDLVLAWNFFDKESRETFQNTLSIDEATWIRAMAWSLWKTLCWPIKGTPVSKILETIYVDYQAIK
jgi:aminoglycoside phosphotransferase (APT) family kinase protein